MALAVAWTLLTNPGFISGIRLPPPPRNWLFPPFNMKLTLLGFVFAPPPLEFWYLTFAPSEVKS